MNLQDLKDDLASWTPAPALEVARRVAALYDTCPNCHGGMMADGRYGCPRCGRTGLELSEEAHDRFGGCADWLELARYLFGDAT